MSSNMESPETDKKFSEFFEAVDQIEDPTLQNRITSELRKRKAEDRLAKSKQNPKKKKKGDNSQKREDPKTIPLKQEEIPIISKWCAAVEIYDPVIKKWGLYSGLTNEPMMFLTYPIILEKPERKRKLKAGSSMICGVPKPELVFFVLAQAFLEIHPDKIDQYHCWKPVKDNCHYYGSSVFKRAVSLNTLVLKKASLRCYGGTNNPVQINWIQEKLGSKATAAVAISDVIHSDKPTYSVERLNEIQNNVNDFFKTRPEIDLNLLKSKIEQAESDSDSDCDSDSESE